MFFNQSKVTRNQIPEKVRNRARHKLARGLGILFLFGWLMYLTVNINGYSQASLINEENLSGPEAELSGAGTVNPILTQLDSLFEHLAVDRESELAVAEKSAIMTTILKQLKLPEGATLTDNAVMFDDSAILYAQVSKDGGQLTVSSLFGTQSFTDTQTFSTYLRGFTPVKFAEVIKLQEKREAMLTTLVNLMKTEKVDGLFKTKELSFEVSEKDLILTNSKGSELLTVTPQPLTAKYAVSGQNNASLASETLELELGKLIDELDVRSELEKIIDTQKEEFVKLIEGGSLNESLQKVNLRFGEVVEKPDGLYVDMLDKSNVKIMTIMLEKGTGLINIIDSSGATSLENYFESQKKKSEDLDLEDDSLLLADVSSEQTEPLVYLLAGKHGSLTDTLMLAFVDDSARKVHLLSVPRDLFWQGRKINSYFAYYEMEGVVDQLERIFAIDIQNYMLVDMYAFIEVVNILGGVEITLERSVIDPTYKTFDDGKWGTLHYEPGTYHLNGVQALRLARSRHTSSDFARAERQQMILQSLQAKAKSMSFWDVGKLGPLAKAVLEYLDTDVSVAQSLDIYNKYKDYEVVNVGVMSTGNVLYSTYSNIDGYHSCVNGGGTDCSKGAYILLPRNDNWAYLPRYVRSVTSSN